MPIERFKDAYENHRYNPFTEADMAVDKCEDNLDIPSGSPFVIQLLEVPRKNTPTSVTVYCYDDEANFTEVATSPAQGEFRVDYPPEDGQGTGLIEFNQNDGGKEVKIDYKATGSPMLGEFLDTKVSYPTGDPNDHQILGFVSGAPEWRYNPIRYFHEGPVIYHASGENESCLLFRFKKSAKEATAILELKGAKLHQGYYTELKEHNHGVGTLAVSSVSDHSHAKGSLSGSQPLHNHSLSGNTGNQDTSHTHEIPDNHRHTSVQGGTSYTGYMVSGDERTPKTYPNQLKIYINGVDKTADVLALTGLTQFGDGTGSHAFVTTGSGEMDISALVSASQFHEIKITAPISGNGGRVLLHCELY